MTIHYEPTIDNAKDIYDQGRNFYFYTQYNQEEMYANFDDMTFKYEKDFAAKSYANGYLFTMQEDGSLPQSMEDVSHANGYFVNIANNVFL